MSTNELDRGTVPGVVAVPPGAAISEEVLATAERLGVGRYLSAVTAFTLEIFGSLSDVRVVPDPEAPNEVHINFDVPVTGSVDDLLEKDTRWSRRLHATIPRCWHFLNRHGLQEMDGEQFLDAGHRVGLRRDGIALPQCAYDCNRIPTRGSQSAPQKGSPPETHDDKPLPVSDFDIRISDFEGWPAPY